MCGMCGLLGGGRHWSNTVAPGAGANARRQRLVQVAHANRVLGLFRLRLDDFHGQSFVVSSPTGAREMADDLMQVWQAAEKMLGRPLDPLTLFIDEDEDAGNAIDGADARARS
jgi:hypothetical protein